jgi:DNA polymerase II large subunit
VTATFSCSMCGQKDVQLSVHVEKDDTYMSLCKRVAEQAKRVHAYLSPKCEATALALTVANEDSEANT